MIEITARAKAFSTEAMQEYRFSVESDGTVRVYDDVAGHFTLCHSLSAGQQQRIRKLAKEAAE